MADVGLSAFDAGVSALEILIWIVSKVEEATRYKEKCHVIGNMARLLQRVMQRQGYNVVNRETATQLVRVLREVARFVNRCTVEYNIAQRAWELIWVKRLPRLLGELKDWTLFVILQNTVMLDVSISEARTLQEETLQIARRLDAEASRHVELNQTALDQLDVMQSTLQELRRERSRERQPTLTIRFGADNANLQFDQTRHAQEGRRFGTLNGLRIEAREVRSVRDGPHLLHVNANPRAALIYEKITSNTLVHPYFGLAERENTCWTIFEDLSSAPNLGSFLQEESSTEDLQTRVRIAYHVANTMAYLHSLGILLKVLCDRNVIIVSRDGRFMPLLTSLDRARMIFAASDENQAFDVRYEAPEYRNTHVHNVATDIWSLGVLIRQLIVKSPPYGISEFVSSRHMDPAVDQIRNAQAAEALRFTLNPANQALHTLLASIVEDCCSTQPKHRPSASVIAHRLFECLLPIHSIRAQSIAVDLATACKSRVLGQIASLEANGRALRDSVARGDVTTLRSLADEDQDASAASILGTALLLGIAGIPDGDLASNGEDAEAEIRQLHAEYKVRLAHAALPYLQFAVDADIHRAPHYLAKAHARLYKHYDAIAREAEVISGGFARTNAG